MLRLWIVFLSLLSISTAFAAESGQYTHSIQIGVPPGSVGLTPKIQLEYSSEDAANGSLGVGWSLSGVPIITRWNKKGGLKYDGTDSFVGPGGRLIAMDDKRQEFHLEQENWDRFIPDYSSCALGARGEPCSWVMHDHMGNKLYFGNTADSYIESRDSDGKIQYEGAARIWALSRFENALGYSYKVLYEKNDLGAYRLREISYTHGPGISKHRQILFNYSARPDPLLLYKQGGFVFDDKRLSTIAVNSDARAVRSYQLCYADDRNCYPQQTKAPALSHLLSVREFGSDGKTQAPAAEFGWSHFEIAPQFEKQTLTNVPASGPNALLTRPLGLDLNGDGFGDYARIYDASIHILTSKAGKEFTESIFPLGNSAVPLAINSSQAFATDMNMDGKDDIVRMFSGGLHLLTSDGKGTFAVQVIKNPGDVLLPVKNYPAGILDINNDQLPDIVRVTNNGLYIFENQGGNRFSSRIQAFPNGMTVSLDSDPIQFTDFNADGFIDISVVLTNGVRILWNTGRGEFSAYNSMISGNFASLSAQGEKFSVDWNGDGLNDVVVLLSNGVQILQNEGNGNFRYMTQAYPSGKSFPSTTYAYLLFDIDGDGRADPIFRSNSATIIVQNSPQGLSASSVVDPSGFQTTVQKLPFVIGDADGDGTSDIIRFAPNSMVITKMKSVPYSLISSVLSASGGLTKISYQNSISFPNFVPTEGPFCDISQILTEKTNCKLPDRSNRLLLRKVEVSDGRSQSYANTYDYGESTLELLKSGEFRSLGFGWVSETGPEGDSSVTHYYQQWPLIGTAKKHETRSPTGDRLTLDTSTYRVLEQCGANGCVEAQSSEPVLPFMVVPKESTSTNYHLTSKQAVSTRVTTVVQDAYGSVKKESIYLNGKHLTTKVFDYIHSYAEFVVGLVYGEKLCRTADCSIVESQTLSYFDNLELGNVGARRQLTKSSTAHLDKWDHVQNFYDDYGNVFKTIDARGLETTIVFDDAYQLFPETKVDIYRSTLKSVYDDRFGVLIRSEEPNGTHSITDIDPLGRPYLVTVYDQAKAILSQKRILTSTGPAASDSNYIESCDKWRDKWLCKREFKDAMGRDYMVSNSGPNGQWLVQAKQFDAKNRVAAFSQPYFENQPIYWNTIEYDAHGRSAKEISSNGKSWQSFSYDTVPAIQGSVFSVKTTNAVGQVSVKWMNEKNQVIQQTEGYGTKDAATTVYEYSVEGLQTAVKGPGGSTSTFEHDASYRLQSKTIPGMGTYFYTYHDIPGTPEYGSVKTETYPKPGSPKETITKTMSYDRFGRSTGFVSTEGSSYTASYSEVSNLSKARFSATSYVSQGLKIEKVFSYHPRGYADKISVKITDLEGKIKRFVVEQERDEIDRVIRSSLPDGSWMVSCFDPETGSISGIKLDADANCLGGHEILKYSQQNQYGQYEKLTFGNGVEQNYSIHPESGEVESIQVFHQQNSLFDQTYEFDGADNLVALQDKLVPDLSVSNTSYDALGRIRQLSIGSRDFHYNFDTAGNLVDKAGKIQSFNAVNQMQTSGVERLVWDPSGVLLSRSTDKATRSYSYDGEMRMIASAKNGFEAANYFYDVDGVRLLKIVFDNETKTVSKTFYLTPGFEWRETYKDGKLQQCQKTILVSDGKRMIARNSQSGCSNFATAGMDNSRFHEQMSRIYNPQDPVGVTFKAHHYLARLLADKSHAFWLTRSMFACLLLSFAILMLWQYRLNRKGRSRNFGKRLGISLLVAQFALTSCGLEQRSAVSDLKGETAPIDTDWLADGFFYYHHNYQGSVAVVTDSQGNETSRQSYLPFGETDALGTGRLHEGRLLAAAVGSKHLYTGQEKDSESDLYYYVARYYDPELGIFTTADRITPGDGTIAMGLNRYMYVAGNPLKHTDPTGHSWLSKAAKSVKKGIIGKNSFLGKALGKSATSFLNKLVATSMQYTPMNLIDIYNNGGWKGLACFAATTVANAYLAVFTGGTVSVSLSYTYEGGYSFGVTAFSTVGVNFNKQGVRYNIGYSYTPAGSSVSFSASVSFGDGKPSFSAGASYTQQNGGTNYRAERTGYTTMGMDATLQGGKVTSSQSIRDSSVDFTPEAISKAWASAKVVYNRADGRFYVPGYGHTIQLSQGYDEKGVMQYEGAEMRGEGTGANFSASNFSSCVFETLFGLVGAVPSPRAIADARKIKGIASHLGIQNPEIVAHSNGNFTTGMILRFRQVENAQVFAALDAPLTGEVSHLLPGLGVIFAGTNTANDTVRAAQYRVWGLGIDSTVINGGKVRDVSPNSGSMFSHGSDHLLNQVWKQGGQF